MIYNLNPVIKKIIEYRKRLLHQTYFIVICTICKFHRKKRSRYDCDFLLEQKKTLTLFSNIFADNFALGNTVSSEKKVITTLKYFRHLNLIDVEIIFSLLPVRRCHSGKKYFNEKFVGMKYELKWTCDFVMLLQSKHRMTKFNPLEN